VSVFLANSVGGIEVRAILIPAVLVVLAIVFLARRRRR
jgi:hypothetical protein